MKRKVSIAPIKHEERKRNTKLHSKPSRVPPYIRKVVAETIQRKTKLYTAFLLPYVAFHVVDEYEFLFCFIKIYHGQRLVGKEPKQTLGEMVYYDILILSNVSELQTPIFLI